MGKSKNYKNSTISIWDLEENITFYRERLIQIAMNCFTWYNLPENFDERYMELLNVSQGYFIGFLDDITEEYYSLGGALQGKFTMYGIPKERYIIGATGDFRYKCNDTNSVICYDNRLHNSPMNAIEFFAKDLGSCKLTKDINMMGQRTPVLLVCDDAAKLSYENFYLKIASGNPVVSVNKDMDVKNTVTALDLQAEYKVDKIRKEMTCILADAYNYFGIGSLDIEKSERLIQSEVETSQGITRIQRESRLNSRREFCNKFNKMFGTNIAVEFNQAVVEDAQRLAESSIGGEDNGDIYNIS